MKTEYNINGQRRKGYILLKYCFLKILKFTDVSSDPLKEFHSLKKHISRLRFPPVSFSCRERKQRFISSIMGVNFLMLKILR